MKTTKPKQFRDYKIFLKWLVAPVLKTATNSAPTAATHFDYVLETLSCYARVVDSIAILLNIQVSEKSDMAYLGSGATLSNDLS